MTIMTGYIYDADGQRAAKGTISAWGCNPSANGFATTNDYVLGPGGEQVTEMAVSGSTITWLHTNVWAGGRLIATYDETGKGLHFYQDDPLGTRRSQSDPSGAQELTCTSLPFGDALSCSGPGADPTEQHFTGKERDQESGNDYFFARYHSSSTGRFLSPDWAAKVEPVPYAKLENPQSLNLYAYVENDPPTGLDPDGHQIRNLFSVENPCGSANDVDCSPAEQEQFRNQQQAQQQAQQQPADQKLTNVVYNELGGGRANPKAKPGAPGSAQDLANGRQAVAEIANRVMNAGHPNRVAHSYLNDNAATKTNAYALSRVAADAALNGSNISNGATQYRTRVNGDITTPVGRSSTNPGTPVSQHYGPFIEGNHTFVIVVAQ